MGYVFALDDCEQHLAEMVGGKAVGLGSLQREGLHVPLGFALGTHAYREFVSETGLDGKIHALLRGADSLEAQVEASARIRLLFEERELIGPVRDELTRAYDALDGGGQLPVAIRSSAISEDAAEASFAGEHETYLWIQGQDAVARAVVRSGRASSRRRRSPTRAVPMFVPARRRWESWCRRWLRPKPRVMFTIDPVTGDRSQIAIELLFGLGEAVVAGEVIPTATQWTR